MDDGCVPSTRRNYPDGLSEIHYYLRLNLLYLWYSTFDSRGTIRPFIVLIIPTTLSSFICCWYPDQLWRVSAAAAARVVESGRGGPRHKPLIKRAGEKKASVLLRAWSLMCSSTASSDTVRPWPRGTGTPACCYPALLPEYEQLQIPFTPQAPVYLKQVLSFNHFGFKELNFRESFFAGNRRASSIHKDFETQPCLESVRMLDDANNNCYYFLKL